MRGREAAFARRGPVSPRGAGHSRACLNDAVAGAGEMVPRKQTVPTGLPVWMSRPARFPMAVPAAPVRLGRIPCARAARSERAHPEPGGKRLTEVAALCKVVLGHGLLAEKLRGSLRAGGDALRLVRRI